MKRTYDLAVILQVLRDLGLERHEDLKRAMEAIEAHAALDARFREELARNLGELLDEFCLVGAGALLIARAVQSDSREEKARARYLLKEIVFPGLERLEVSDGKRAVPRRERP